jgi:hypothetical protein
MQIGVSGHQHRPGIDWDWVTQTVRNELAKRGDVRAVLSSLATGSDQIVADVAINLHIPVLAVLPIEGYEHYFRGRDLSNYRRLLGRCKVIQLAWKGDPRRGFLEAGKFIVDHCDMLFAVWDGKAAEGFGGTSDVVNYAERIRRKVAHIDPIAKVVNFR